MDFAFFVVNFGYSKKDYLSLTPAEKMFIMKAYESRMVSESTLDEQAVELAVGNVLRKKGKQRQHLWKKKAPKINVEESKMLFYEIQKMEEEQGKDWVRLVHQNAGIRMPKGAVK